jgi:aspartate/methionine/tyrosine aminotransferase
MVVRSLYLAWAARHYGKVRFDLATSGMSPPSAEDLGPLSIGALTDPGSWTALRAAIARYNDVPEGEAVAALGTTQALWLAYSVLTQPGDDVLVEDPGYEPLERIAESVGARVIRFSRPASARYAIDPDRVARAMTARTKVVVVSSPHNPSGLRADARTLRDLAQVAKSRGAHVVVDEVYAPFDELVDPSGIFHGTARKIAPNVLSVGSLGKCYGLGGARVGWLLGPREVIADAGETILVTAGALPLAHAGVALHAFDRIGTLADRTRRSLGGKRERVARWAQDLGLDWSAPESGLFGLVRLPGEGDLTAAIERLAAEREVLVGAGAFFGVPRGFRLSWSIPEDRLDEGLARLGDGVRQWTAR